MSLTKRLLASLPGPLAAGLGVVEVVLFLRLGLALALIPIGIVAAGAAILYFVGTRLFATHPKQASYLAEAGLCFQFIVAIIACSVALGVTIRLTPQENATVTQKSIWTASIAAIASYLGAALINPSGAKWNPVKALITKAFSDKFPAQTEDNYVKDARDSVKLDSFGAIVPNREYVDGWGWTARHRRAVYIQEALHRPATPPANSPAVTSSQPPATPTIA